MEDAKINYIELLPTEERRQTAERLKRYAEYFQNEISRCEKKKVRQRLHEAFSQGKEEKNKKNQERKEELQTYFDFILSISKSAYENASQMTEKEEQIPELCAISSLYGAASTNVSLTALGKSDFLKEMTGLSRVTSLSDKEQAIIYKKAFETAMNLLMQSDISEEKIKNALTNTMDKIQKIKDKYADITDSEEMAKLIQDECVVEVSSGVENTSDYNKFKKYISDTIGSEAWEKMTHNAQIFLITGELLYDQWKVYGDENIDFAPICMSVSKALEVEVTRRYFTGYFNYLNRNDMKIPADMLVKENGEFREKREDEFMLGNITGVTGYAAYLDTNMVRLVGRLTDENQKFLKYAKEDLFSGLSEVKCIEIIKKHIFNIKKVCVNYRNPSAHKQKISKVSARECLDFMVDVKKVIGEMLDDCSW